MNVVLNVLKLTETMLKYKYLIFFHQVSFFVRPRIFGAYLVNSSHCRERGFNRPRFLIKLSMSKKHELALRFFSAAEKFFSNFVMQKNVKIVRNAMGM